MPTRDDITELDLERIRALLIDILSSDKYCALFKLQEVYELGIVLISAQGGYKYVSDTYCKSVVDGCNFSLMRETVQAITYTTTT